LSFHCLFFGLLRRDWPATAALAKNRIAAKGSTVITGVIYTQGSYPMVKATMPISVDTPGSLTKTATGSAVVLIRERRPPAVTTTVGRFITKTTTMAEAIADPVTFSPLNCFNLDGG